MTLRGLALLPYVLPSSYIFLTLGKKFDEQKVKKQFLYSIFFFCLHFHPWKNTALSTSAEKLACQHDSLIDIEDIFTFCPDITLFEGITFTSGEQVSFLLLWHIVNTQYSSWHPEAQ